jgi:zinc protease
MLVLGPNNARPRHRVPVLAAATLMMLSQSLAQVQAQPLSTPVSTFTLANGLQVVVVPDHRAPVVTHYVWYRAGAADETPGVSGVAHFLEHLMFKSTDKIASGDFSRIVARLGGQDNAFTTHDMTGYFQRIAKDRLRTVMEMEADRMQNLRLTEKEVTTERDVIMEERRSRTDNNPSSILAEQMSASLYQNHPYRIPIIGWMHEMAKLSREDALAFYTRFYAPNNAIVVVAGDVTVEEVRKLADATYGVLKPNSTIPATRVRPQEPPHPAPRRVELKDARVGNASIRRFYLTPSLANAKPGEAEALYVMMKILGNGPTSRLYQRLVAEENIASNAGGWYAGTGLDGGTIGLYAVAAAGVGLDRVEISIDAVLRELCDKGVTEDELGRAKKAFISEFIYESDSQSQLARRYGEGLLIGQTLDEINNWPTAIMKVTAEDILHVANAHLDLRKSVTGTLLPAAPEAVAQPAPKPVSNRS